MVTSDHLEQARTRLSELERLTGYSPFSPEWFEAMGELADIEPVVLQEYAVETSAFGHSSLMGFLTGVLADQYAASEVRA